ncbi:MAG TPA: hypothetical protein VEW68_08350 [Patescibacteria group bacterium]|nr:hypothetical protein [Patescibacteria group bacterium]
MKRGQAMLELAVCVPVVLLMAIGAAACVQVADAASGLQAAADAAAATAARAPDAATAETAARLRFDSVAAGYPLSRPAVSFDLGGFQRIGQVTVTATATVDVDWAGLLHLPGSVLLRARAVAQIDSWRTRR